MSTFYIIATPIGNLEDMSLRAIRILKEVDIVLCEDTRMSKRLFTKYDIHTPMLSYHAQSGELKTEIVLEKIKEGKNIALITDAGTPGISDPGAMLVSRVRAMYPTLQILSIPGPSALTSALSIAGVPINEFIFLGFMPNKKGRETIFKEIENKNGEGYDCCNYCCVPRPQDSKNLVSEIFEFEAMPPIKVKGKSEPQAIYAVLGRKDDPDTPKSMNEVRKIVGIDFDSSKKISAEEKEVKYEIIGQ